MADFDAPGEWSVWTPMAWLAGCINGNTSHGYSQNINALGFVVSEKNIFMLFLL